MNIPFLTINKVIKLAGARNYGRNNDTRMDSIHSTVGADDEKITIEAVFTAQPSNQGKYDVKIVANSATGEILSTTCSCPVRGCCEHCCRVLRESTRQIIVPNPMYIEQDAKRRRTESLKQQAIAVFVIITCKSEPDSGSDYKRRRDVKDNLDQDILGIYFTRTNANKFAKKYAMELQGGIEEEDEDDDDEDTDLFSWIDKDGCEAHSCSKVWVEERPIEDASKEFHRSFSFNCTSFLSPQNRNTSNTFNFLMHFR
jgi:hypothetical protein